MEAILINIIIKIRKLFGFLGLIAAVAASVATADIVETTNGTRLVGRIMGITDKTITMETEFAGALIIKKELVVGFSTEENVFVRVANGQTYHGKVHRKGDSQMEIAGPEVLLATEMAKISAAWRKGGEDPEVIKRKEEYEASRGKWSYEVGFDLSGKSGNSEEFGSAARLKADLTRPNHSLGFYLSYDQAEKNGGQTSNEIIAGATYNSFFKEKLGWFVRSEMERDQFEDIDFRVTSAGGLSYRFFKQEHHSLSGRAGGSYRSEKLENGEKIKSPGLDFGLKHFYRFDKIGRVTTDLKFIPSVEDFSDFRLTQDTGLEFSLGGGKSWKVRFGVSNFFNNNPAPGKERLDTTYYTRLLLTWD